MFDKVELRLLVLVFFSAFFFSEISFQTSNYTSRLFLTQAIVDHQTVRLNEYRDFLGLDHAVFQDNLYSDKPPGSSLLMIPQYLFLGKPVRWLISTGSTDSSQEQLVGWVVQVSSLPVYSALAMVALYRILGLLHITQRRFYLVLISYFGTLMFPFSTIGMGEMYTVPLVIWGSYFFLKGIQGGSARDITYSACFFSGSLLTTHQTIVFAVVAGAILLSCSDRTRLLIYYVPPLLVAVVVILAYNWLLFGDIFTFAVNYWAPGSPPTVIYELPSFSKLVDMLISPWKGIFFYSPVLLFSFLGYWRLYQAGKRNVSLYLLLSFVSYFGYLTINAGWYGGSEYGFRYIIPALPFLCIGMAIALWDRTWGHIEWITIIVSLAICVLGGITDPHVKTLGRFPILDYNLPYFQTYATNNLVNHLLYERGVVNWWLRLGTTVLFLGLLLWLTVSPEIKATSVRRLNSGNY